MRLPGGPAALAVRGSALMAVGLVISGLGTLVMVGIASRGLPAQEFAVFATWWLTATILAPVFGVFEVYLARALLARIASGADATSVIAQLLGLALLAVAGVTVAVIAFEGVLSGQVFGGDRSAAPMIPAFVFVVALQSIQRGVAAGRRAFGAIGFQLSIDGTLRAGIAALAISLDGGSLVYLAPVFAGVLSLAVTSARVPGWLRFPRPLSRAVTVSPIGWLLVAASGPVVIANAVAPWFAAASTDDVLVAGFAAALLVSRVPTQLASAAFAPAMAHMARLVDEGDEPRMRAARRSALGWAILVGASFVALFVWLGPGVLSAYVGSAYEVPRWSLFLLATASAVLLVATIQQAALTARNCWGTIAAAWLVGAVVFGAALLVPLDALLRASGAPLLGVLAAAAVMELSFHLRPGDAGPRRDEARPSGTPATGGGSD